MFDAIIVGSGPAGVAAALALRGKNMPLLDVGIQLPHQTGLLQPSDRPPVRSSPKFVPTTDQPEVESPP